MQNLRFTRILILTFFSLSFLLGTAQETKPDTVQAGIYITSIHDIDFKEKEYTTNLWLWLKYKNKDWDIMRKAFDHILSKFPDHRAKIIELYNRDEDFRILCDDYLTSVQTIEEYRLKTLSDREYESEFLRIYLDLEKEIIRLLEANAK